jgi:hypothetical protein
VVVWVKGVGLGLLGFGLLVLLLVLLFAKGGLQCEG